MFHTQSTVSTITLLCFLVRNIDSQYLYGPSETFPPDQVKWVRGREFVLDIPKYNMKITSTVKDDGLDDHGTSCGCAECSSQDRQDTDPWTTYELVPIQYTTLHSEPTLTVYRQAEPSQEPLLGSPRHKHKQDWFYSAPSWLPSGSESMNILRAAEPRGIIKSNSHFVKIDKNHHGKSFVHAHSSSFIKTKPKHGLSVHKNLHLHKFRDSEDFDNFGRVAAPREVDNRFVGSHMFAAPRWRRDTPRRRTKRGVLEFVRLVGDHDTKLDMSKTAENVGAATKNVFESDKSPVYHMRNLVGSSQDALMSMLSARPRGVLIPSKYRIVSADETPMVGAINPGVYQQNGQPPADQEQQVDDEAQSGEETPQCREYSGRSPVEFDDTFNRIGAILRDSVQRAHKSAEHAVDAVHSARQVVATARKYWPKILLPYAGAVEVEKKQRGSEIVGSAQDPQFVGIGRIMDYFGVTGEHPPTEPRLGSARYISEEEQLLNNAKTSLGTTTYRQFMDKMKKELGRYQRLTPKAADGEQVGSRLLPRLPLHPLHRPLLVDPNLHRIRTALRLPPRPSPALVKLRNALKAKPVQRLPKIRNPLLGAPKPTSPALAKLRDALKPLPKAEAKVDKPVSPALAKLREAIAQRKAARKSPLVGKAKSVTEENEVEPKVEPAVNNADYAYSDEDTDKSAQVDQPDPPVGGPQAQSVITSPHLDESEEEKPEAEVSPTGDSQKESTPALDRLRTKLQEKSKERTSNVDKGDLLGRALEILRSRAQKKSNSSPAVEEVGAAQLTTQTPACDDDELGSPHASDGVKFAAVPVPIFTKEMKTPFMGFATQKDLDEYFKNLYCAECKKNREADET